VRGEANRLTSMFLACCDVVSSFVPRCFGVLNFRRTPRDLSLHPLSGRNLLQNPVHGFHFPPRTEGLLGKLRSNEFFTRSTCSGDQNLIDLLQLSNNLNNNLVSYKYNLNHYAILVAFSTQSQMQLFCFTDLVLHAKASPTHHEPALVSLQRR